MTPFQRLQARVHAHPHARLLEFLFWGVPGALIVALSFIGWRTGNVGDAIVVILAVIGTCLVGWGAIPPAKAKAKASQPGRRRREIAEQRRR